MKSKTDLPRGVLNKSFGNDYFRLSRYEPSSNLAHLVEHYWVVRWNLIDREPYRQEILAHPSVHLVFEEKHTCIWGVVTGKFTRVLKGKGKVLGVKFKPGGFYPFYKRDISLFSDDVLPFQLVFGEDLKKLEGKILDVDNEEAMVEVAEQFLLRNLSNSDPKVAEINHILDFVLSNSEVVKVDDLVDHFSYSKRTLQRIFKQYVGVSPKWVIKRYRLHEVAEKIATKRIDNWAALAIGAGYFDQAHFIRDFKSIVGKTPAEYADSLKI